MPPKLNVPATTITLSSAGFYNLSHEFHAGVPVKNKMFQ